MNEHVVTYDGPPDYQAHGARCQCGWVGPTRVTLEAAKLDGWVHVRDNRQIA